MERAYLGVFDIRAVDYVSLESLETFDLRVAQVLVQSRADCYIIEEFSSIFFLAGASGRLDAPEPIFF